MRCMKDEMLGCHRPEFGASEAYVIYETSSALTNPSSMTLRCG